jgi:hypothetical protein
MGDDELPNKIRPSIIPIRKLDVLVLLLMLQLALQGSLRPLIQSHEQSSAPGLSPLPGHNPLNAAFLASRVILIEPLLC